MFCVLCLRLRGRGGRAACVRAALVLCELGADRSAVDVWGKTAADYSSMLFFIRGAKSFFDWRSAQLAEYAARPVGERTQEAALALRAASDARFAETVALEAVDDRTLRVTLEQPVPYFLDLCSFPPLFVPHAPSVEAHVRVDPTSGRVDQDHSWTKPPALISSGAYRLTSWRFKRDMRLERR